MEILIQNVIFFNLKKKNPPRTKFKAVEFYIFFSKKSDILAKICERIPPLVYFGPHGILAEKYHTFRANQKKKIYIYSVHAGSTFFYGAILHTTTIMVQGALCYRRLNSETQEFSKKNQEMHRKKIQTHTEILL